MAKHQAVPEDIAARIERLAWWDWDHTRLHAALEDMRAFDAEGFLEKHGG